MKKTLLKLAFISLVLSLTVALTGVAHAMEFADGKLTLNGFFKNWTGYRWGAWGHERGSGLSIFRNVLQLEAEAKVYDNVSLYTIFRGAKEPAYNLEDEARALGNFDSDLMNKNELREYYLAWQATDTLWVAVGKQQVAWGDLGSGSLRVMDILNPLDLTWHYALEAFEDMRKPLNMINIIYSMPAIDANLQVVWIPGLEETAERVNSLFVSPGHRWGLNNVLVPGMPPDYVIPLPEALSKFEGDVPGIERKLSDSAGGFRFQKTSGGITWAISDAYTHDFAANPITGEHLRLNVFGVSANWYDKYTNGVWRFEAGHFHGLGYVSNIGTLVEEDTIKYGLGYDRNTFFYWLPNGDRRSVLTVMQILGTFVLNNDDIDVGTDKSDIMFTLYVNWGVANDRVQFNIYPAYNIDRKFGMIQAWIDYKPQIFAGNLTITPKVNLLYGEHAYAGDFGITRGCTEGLLEIKYEF